ncbi:MAG: molybdate ABC transporter substrate-binding protein [Alphaproteobacteria bacterium]
MKFSAFIPVILVLTTLRPALGAEPLTVFAATSTVIVKTPLEYNWIGKTGEALKIVLGSSGSLARQIEYLAPAHIFISANPDWFDYLVRKKRVDADTGITIMQNRLVLIAPAASRTVTSLPGHAIEMASRSKSRIAIGDPRHVPAGKYAKEALSSMGQWKIVAPLAIRTNSVRLALALVERGEAPLGIVYRTDAGLAKKVRIVADIDPSLHEPIRYIAAATKRTHKNSARFLAYLQSEAARTIFRKAGFIVPE